MDIDLVLNDDVANLYNIDLKGPIAASIDICPLSDLEGQGKTIANLIKNEIGFTKEDMYSYFNCGVTVYNLDYWREYDVLIKLIKMLETNYYRLADQTVQNLFFKGKATLLSFKWNYIGLEGIIKNFPIIGVIPFRSDFEKAGECPRLIHFHSGPLNHGKVLIKVILEIYGGNMQEILHIMKN